MTFLAPWLLAALPAVGVPVIIHLLNRGKPQPIRWAAMQFLLESVRKNRRRLQLRDVILMILRAMVVLFLVLLFARPASWVPGGGTGAVTSPVSAMIVIDVSASMAQSDGRRSRLDLAREEAMKTLEQLSDDSLCGLILATDRATAVVPRPSNNLELVRENLGSVRGTSAATDLFPAIERAFQELDRSPGEQKIVFVFTDSQESAWRERASIRGLATAHPGIALRSVAIGSKGEPNTAITNISVQPANPARGEAAAVRVDVTNLTDKPLEALRVTLAANRERPQDEASLPQIPAGKSASAALKITFDATGFQTLRAEIPQDLFAVDNMRSMAIQVGNPRRFLIVADPVAGDPRSTPEYFLRTALGAMQKGAEVEVVPGTKLTKEKIDHASAIFICSPASLSDNGWGLLEKFVRNGGGIVVFPEGKGAGALGATPATRWLPGTLGKPVPQPAAWVQAGMDHPVTAMWADANRTRLTNITSDRRFELTAGQGAATLAKYSDGIPVAVSSDVGGGKAVLFGTSPIPASTKLVLHPYFPILIGDLVNFLAGGQSATRALLPGDSFSIAVPAALIGKKVTITSDRGEEPMGVGAVAAAETEGRIFVASVDSPGGYRVFVEGEAAAVSAFSVALAPSESVLQMADPVGIEPERPAAGVEVAGDYKVPHELWMAFAILLLLLFFTELAVAHRFTITR